MMASPSGLPDSMDTQLGRQLVKPWQVTQPLEELSAIKRAEAVDKLMELHLFYLRTAQYAELWQRQYMIMKATHMLEHIACLHCHVCLGRRALQHE